MINVTLIGTAATMPLPGRALASAFVNCCGHSILFDCGEGTQSAARAVHVNLMKTELIALTHYHGDHTLGLPGLLQSWGVLGRSAPVTVTGPAGLERALAPVLELCGALPYELRLVPFPEDGLRLESWPSEMRLESFRTEHRCASTGYSLQLSRPGRFLAGRAVELGIPQKLWSVLQHGESVEGFCPSDVLGPPRKGLKLIYTGDSQPCGSIVEAARGADLMICESTFPDEDAEQAAAYGHCTVSQAAQMAADAGVSALWLSHFSQSIKEPEELLPAASSVFPAATAGTDGLSVTLRFEE